MSASASSPVVPEVKSTWRSKISDPHTLAYSAVVLFCLILNWGALRAHFASDDVMNMGWYWRDGFWYMLWHSLTFWSSAYRPMGAFYYLPLFKMFGMNPLPYRITMIAIMLINTYLSCRVGELLSGSPAVGFFTGLLAGAHGSMLALYYQNSFIYDVLVYFFTMWVLIAYVGIRKQNKTPDLWQTLGILLLFIAALDSKEIGVVTAGFILAYEVFFHGGPDGFRDLPRWIRHEGLVPLLMVVFAVIYTAGKLLQPSVYSSVPEYQMHVSFAKWIENNSSYLNELFYTITVGLRRMIAVASALVLGAIFLKWSPVIRWCCFYILIATLPISFIPRRGGAALYLPLFGWALLIAAIAVTLLDRFTPKLGFSYLTLSSSSARNILMVFLALFLGWQTVNKSKGKSDGFFNDQRLTWAVISELQNNPFRPKPNSSVVFLDDPFRGLSWDWGAVFIAQLVWHDHSVDIRLNRKTPLSAEELARTNTLVTIENEKLRVVRTN